MRYIGGLIVFALATVAFHWCAIEVALRLWGREARATVSSVSRSSTSGRSSGYTAVYEFVTEDQGKAYGSCPSSAGARGGSLRVRYLRHDPSWNEPAINWYNLIWIGVYGALALPLALWSARIFLVRRLHRLGEPEEEEEEADDDADEATESAAEKAAPPAAAPVEALPEEFRNTWPAAWLFSLVLAAAAIVLNLAWIDGREKAAAVPPAPPAAGAAEASAPLPRGATAGNVANGSELGFEGDKIYLGLWRDYQDPAARPSGLYRFALDGSGRAPVGNPRDTERIYSGIQVLGDWIYFRTMDGISRIRKDGTKAQRLTKNDVAAMAVVGEWVYYQHKVLDNAIYRMRLDGSADTLLCRGAVGEMCVTEDGWIYYVNRTDGDRLWRLRHDGTARARLVDQRAGKLLAAGGSLWFTDPGRKSALCRMDPAGTNIEVVAEDTVFALNWADGRLYFNRNNGEIVRCRPDGTDLQTVAPGGVSILVNGDYVYVRRDIESQIYRRSKLDGAEPKEIVFR